MVTQTSDSQHISFECIIIVSYCSNAAAMVQSFFDLLPGRVFFWAGHLEMIHSKESLDRWRKFASSSVLAGLSGSALDKGQRATSFLRFSLSTVTHVGLIIRCAAWLTDWFQIYPTFRLHVPAQFNWLVFHFISGGVRHKTQGVLGFFFFWFSAHGVTWSISCKTSFLICSLFIDLSHAANSVRFAVWSCSCWQADSTSCNQFSAQCARLIGSLINLCTQS